MPEEFDLKKLKEEYPDFFEAMPAELIDLAFSEETHRQIAIICFENGIEDEEKLEKIGYYVGMVLTAQLSPEELSKTLWKELEIEPGTAERIYLAVKRRIFSQVEEILTQLYKKEVIVTKPPETISPTEEKPKKPSSRDIYREPIE